MVTRYVDRDLFLNGLLPDGFDGKRKAGKIREFIKQSS